MATELAGLIQADLAQLTNDANRLAIAPAASFLQPGAHADNAFSFSGVMKQALDNVNAQDQAAGAKVAAVESGKSDDLVGAMLASQQASLSFSMLMQVRNKVMTAVDELIKLPI
ncbi:flagellar hook-basal body complex protein FliE [Telluria beijingensis]|uniref:flagellar hook-basal body complex protein FliE n=1 Tax=Telluria beijingensis TaxID=3068633 RepID=UPI0027956C84|nr:flagellar hook-basal body complex protein FliE [Massilia sp. REN29]